MGPMFKIKLKKVMIFWKDVFIGWNRLCQKYTVDPNNINEIFPQPLWLNHNFKNPTHYIKNWADKGILTIKDLCDVTGLMSFDTLKDRYHIRGTVLDYRYLLSILPDSWKFILKHNKTFPVGDLHINTCQMNLLKPSKGCRIFYDKLMFNNNIPNICAKWEHEFSIGNLDWHKIFMIPRQSLRDTKLLEFQFKFLHGIIYTKKELFKMNLVDNTVCNFCNKTNVSICHLYWECEETQLF